MYSVSIANLNDGGQLRCTNTIDVDYGQPSGVTGSVVELFTSAAGATITPPSITVSNASGTVKFTVSFTPPSSQTGQNVSATLTQADQLEASDQKVNISVNCPQSSSG